MRLVHLSDLHLGFRQYQRLTPTGINQREADVAQSFRRAIDKILELRPDLVLVAGDVFHSVRPSNPAILQAFRQFTRLREEMPDTVTVMVAGNHDAPRTTETGCILRLFTEVGVHVVDHEAQRIVFPGLDLAVLAVPNVVNAPRPALLPDPDVRYNVLTIHGEVEGVLPTGVGQVDRAPVTISLEELNADGWDYVALGHYHVYRELAPNAYYSGSIDYTSTHPWGELLEERKAGIRGKGVIERDLATGAHRFHPIGSSRDLVDLPRIAGNGMTAAELDATIRTTVDRSSPPIDDRIVRLVASDVPRHVARELDHRALRDYKRRATHFHLDTRRPEIIRQALGGAAGRRPSLAETVREKLRMRNLPSDVDRDALVALGLRYLEEADAIVAQTVSPLESA